MTKETKVTNFLRGTKVLTYTITETTETIQMFKVSDEEWEKMKNAKTEEEKWEIFNANVDNNAIPFDEQEEEGGGMEEVSWGIHHE
tara:strand:+ start:219 stop:476 length:258 start_codon:yes stop_codon:yes gene_type:complete